jgi:hypothetical protein
MTLAVFHKSVIYSGTHQHHCRVAPVPVRWPTSAFDRVGCATTFRLFRQHPEDLDPG